MDAFICKPSLPDHMPTLLGKKRTAPVQVPPSSLFPGQLESPRWGGRLLVGGKWWTQHLSACRESQLHLTFHQVTPCTIKISVAKPSPLKISSIIKSSGYRQIGERLVREKILPVKCAAAHQGMWPAANWLGNVLGQNPWNSQASCGSTFKKSYFPQVVKLIYFCAKMWNNMAGKHSFTNLENS